MTTLPSLTASPTRHPGCCLSLSRPLLTTLASLLDSSISPSHHPSDPPALILSIGSGTGLLEELLHAHLDPDPPPAAAAPPGGRWRRRRWCVEGVEVDPPAVNVHLPEDRVNRVPGTWAVLGSRARDAAALLFVYPRDGALVRRYVNAFLRQRRRSPRVGSPREEDEDEERRTTYGEGQGGDSGDRRRADIVIWLGPKCDWEDTGLGSLLGPDDEDELEILVMCDGAGLAEYEMLAALRRKAC
ncbi:hypothetical protein F4802DRAFT_580402 [Xylaria palmicola]|nr:hypothetical protein F4802DRAFT_580402 [Xylaria palmicola]